MRKTIKLQPWLMASVAIFCSFAAASASTPDPDTVSMQLIGPPPGPNMGGYYTAPYTAIIGAAGQTGTIGSDISGVVTPIICDDFQTDVTTETPAWQATVLNVEDILNEGSTTSTAVQWDTTASASQQETDYDVASYLAIEIFNTDQSTSEGQTTAEELSYALWAVFDPSSDPNGPLADPLLTSSELGGIESDLSVAENAVQNGWTPVGYNIDIYTPTPLGASQEYMTVSVAAPEAATPFLLMADLLGLVGMVSLLRRRTSKRISQ